jgi:hypothetical protein
MAFRFGQKILDRDTVVTVYSPASGTTVHRLVAGALRTLGLSWRSSVTTRRVLAGSIDCHVLAGVEPSPLFKRWHYRQWPHARSGSPGYKRRKQYARSKHLPAACPEAQLIQIIDPCKGALPVKVLVEDCK